MPTPALSTPTLSTPANSAFQTDEMPVASNTGAFPPNRAHKTVSNVLKTFEDCVAYSYTAV